MYLSRSVVLTALLLLGAASAAPGASLERFEFRQIHMGVQTRIVLYAPSEADAVAAATHAFRRIAVLDSIMSDYRADSELSRLVSAAGGPPVSVSRELFHVVSRAQQLARLSDGAFDITAGPWVRQWRQARRSGALASPDERHAAARRVGWQHIRLDSAARTIQLLLPGMQLDLGGIGKGYAADEAVAVLRAHGVDRALVEMGGDIVVSGPPPGECGWSIRLPNASADPAPVRLAHAAVSSSGDVEQFVEIGGERFSHIVDPRTGLGLRDRIAVTVIAPDGITADALSTLLSVLGAERGRSLLPAHFPGTRAHFRYLGAAPDAEVPLPVTIGRLPERVGKAVAPDAACQQGRAGSAR
jgi:FAD:protein FMN transferase